MIPKDKGQFDEILAQNQAAAAGAQSIWDAKEEEYNKTRKKGEPSFDEQAEANYKSHQKEIEKKTAARKTAPKKNTTPLILE